MGNFSKNFGYMEMVRSTTADKLRIINIPNPKAKENLSKLCNNILQPIRNAWEKPIIVTSGFRCERLNTAVGGSKTSDHRYGNAADIVTLEDTVEDNKKLFDLIVHLIKSGVIEVGQLINEYDYNWIHISNPTKKHHNEILNIVK